MLVLVRRRNPLKIQGITYVVGPTENYFPAASRREPWSFFGGITREVTSFHSVRMPSTILERSFRTALAAFCIWRGSCDEAIYERERAEVPTHGRGLSRL
jgi:hypothetical protein